MKRPTLLLLILLLGCAHAREPGNAAAQFAQALEAGRLDEAWGSSTGVGREAFAQRYDSPARRAARAQEVRAALQGQGEGVALIRVREGWRVVEAEDAASPGAGPAQALDRFLAAVEAADWSAAWSQLSPTWRGRYSPERLGKDFEAEPLARERLSRARAAARASATVDGGRASFAIAEGKAVRLVLEAGVWKLDALE